MRENEFEKRVQEKMNEFSLAPSAEVWQDVERRIRKEKRRRFIFWWPLFFLLAGGGITATILLTNKKEPQQSLSLNKQPDNAASGPAKKFNQPGQLTPATESMGPEQITNQQENKTYNNHSNKTNTRINLYEKNLQTGQPSARNRPAPGKKIIQEKKEETFSIVETTPKTAEPPAKTEKIDPVPTKQANPLKEPAVNKELAVPEKLSDPSINAQAAKTETPSSDSIANTTSAKTTDKKNKKWDWGFSLAAGRSSVVDGLQFFNNSLFADASTLQTGATSNPSAIPVSRSAMQPNMSWSAGFYRKKSITEKLEINIGLAYQYLSTRISIGNRVDSTRSINNTYSQGITVSDFYRNTGNITYINRYHFLSLTGEISWRIINGNKFKLRWDNGLGYSWLLGSTMLYYDRGLPGYYKDNRLLTKNNLFYTTGFAIPAGTRWSINPFASYGLTRVLKNVDSSRTHYTNFGIRIRYLLNKK